MNSHCALLTQRFSVSCNFDPLQSQRRRQMHCVGRRRRSQIIANTNYDRREGPSIHFSIGFFVSASRCAKYGSRSSKTRKHLTTSLAERILLFLIFFCCFPLSDHSECVVCVFAQLKLVPNNSLSDPDCYGIL